MSPRRPSPVTALTFPSFPHLSIIPSFQYHSISGHDECVMSFNILMSFHCHSIIPDSFQSFLSHSIIHSSFCQSIIIPMSFQYHLKTFQCHSNILMSYHRHSIIPDSFQTHSYLIQSFIAHSVTLSSFRCHSSII